MVQECCDKRNKVRASPKLVKANNIVITLLLVICIAAGGWLLYAASPIIDSLDHLTETMIEQARPPSPPLFLIKLCGRIHMRLPHVAELRASLPHAPCLYPRGRSCVLLMLDDGREANPTAGTTHEAR